ncbi:cyclase family protein [Halomarina halobia]|uniref:Cyclase family protein n=1 Tax=Halomarina halobia TaxID=3033386 RepID=A0ABD6AB21_9EURY|nr:cyclase family protein [Halomarina sp. PSR21]
MLSLANVRVVDLSIGVEPGVASEPWPATIERFDHRAGAEQLAGNLREQGYDVRAEDFPDGIGLAWEEVTAITHTGTHLDAPWHYGPESGGERARTIDEVPLEWCCGDAVVLDVTHLEPGDEIAPEDVDAALADLDVDLSPGDIVLLRTGADALWGTPEYLTEFPGMGADATRQLVERGARVIGTDAYGFDKPFAEMGRRYEETGDADELWPAHFAGREREYCQIEKMANLDALPRDRKVPLVTAPVKIEGASAGWVRPVALLEGDGADGEGGRKAASGRGVDA